MTYLTEDEAKTRWCPKFQVATSGGDDSTYEIDNRPMEHEQKADGEWYPTGRINPYACCIGSACMMWREGDKKFREKPSGRLVDRDLTGHGEWISLGYCGLAGEPK